MGSSASTVEGFNYTPQRLRTTFGDHFGLHPEEAEELGRTEDHDADRQGIADRVYGGRFGNDNPGDGWRYRGRGMFQTTFRANYQAMTEAHRKLFGEYIDFLARPELLEEPKYAARAAAIFWLDHDLPEVAGLGISQDTFNQVRKIVNAREGEAARAEHWKAIEKLEITEISRNLCEFSVSRPSFDMQ